MGSKKNMKKLNLKTLVGTLVIGALSATSSMAGNFGVGVTAKGAYLETTGTETLKTTSVKSSATENAEALIPSGFVQYTFGDNGFVLGFDYVAGEANLGGATNSVQVIPDANTTATSVTVTQDASAQLRDHWTIYAETPAYTPLGLYAKIGYSEVTVETTETLGTGATYGNADVEGTTFGLGMRSGGQGLMIKVEASYTDYDAIALTSSADSAGATNTINADSEMWGAALSVGYNF
jgi:hypothetical protein